MVACSNVEGSNVGGGVRRLQSLHGYRCGVAFFAPWLWRDIFFKSVISVLYIYGYPEIAGPPILMQSRDWENGRELSGVGVLEQRFGCISDTGKVYRYDVN